MMPVRCWKPDRRWVYPDLFAFDARRLVADFCMTCWDEDFGPPNPALGQGSDFNDFIGCCQPGEIFTGMCEGCGLGFFDHRGKRLPETWWHCTTHNQPSVTFNGKAPTLGCDTARRWNVLDCIWTLSGRPAVL